jgi:hypothetical protein
LASKNSSNKFNFNLLKKGLILLRIPSKGRENTGVVMLQENSFFFSPTTYFGAYQHLEGELEEEEADLEDPWQLALDSNTSLLLPQRIGLFIHWCEPNE